MAMKIASRKKKIPSIAKPTPKASPNRPVNLGHRSPNSNERTVPLTAPTAINTATAFDQLRARRMPSSSFRLRPLYSAISMYAGKATPKQARTMWNPRVNPIWLRAASKLDEESARRGTRFGIRSRPGAYSCDGRSQDGDRVERRSSAASNAKGGADEEELPASVALTRRQQVTEVQVVQEMNPHRVQSERVHGKVDPL